MKRMVLCAALLGGAACGDDAPIVVTSALPEVRLGQAYDVKVEATEGSPPYRFSVESGALPSGIEIKAETGQITGIAGSPGKHPVTIAVTDDGDQTGTKDLTLYVIPDPLTILTRQLPSAREASAYDAVLDAEGGVAPYTWSLESGALPAGLEVRGEGSIGGTPSEYGGFDFTVMVDDAEDGARLMDLHLFVVSLNPIITTSTLPKGREGEPYSATLLASGGTSPYDWSLQAGSLPAGVSLAIDGSLTGIPAQAGDFAFTVLVTDAEGRTDMVDIPLRIVAPLQITTPAIPQIIASRPIDAQFEATGGEPPYRWSLAGALPAGVSFTPEGRISGNSDEVGVHPVTVRVTDTEGFRDSALFEVRVSDRFVFEVAPMVQFPPVCTGTTVSYVHVPLEVSESMQIEDLDVSVELTYQQNGQNASNADLKVVLVSPDGTQAPLCGDGAGIPGARLCEAPVERNSGGLSETYDDDGPAIDRPDRPLSAFDGENPLGTWHLRVAVWEPRCNRSGVVQRVAIFVRDDRSTEDYAIVRGFTRNNLLLSPWLRVQRPGDDSVEENELFLSATIYSAGPNGKREGGKGDDVPSTVPLTWQWAGNAIPGVSLTNDGHVVAGEFTGASQVMASGGGEVVTVPLFAVPPDWNPMVRIP